MTTTTHAPHDVLVEHAPKVLDWIHHRGGIAIWHSIDLSDPSFSLMTPARTPDGQPTPKPHWKVDETPSRIITEPRDVRIITAVEVTRFRVGVRLGAQGLKLKVTDGGSRRIRAALAKAGPEAWHGFDYATQEAVIYRPGTPVSLEEWR